MKNIMKRSGSSMKQKNRTASCSTSLSLSQGILHSVLDSKIFYVCLI